MTLAAVPQPLGSPSVTAIVMLEMPGDVPDWKVGVQLEFAHVVVPSAQLTVTTTSVRGPLADALVAHELPLAGQELENVGVPSPENNPVDR